jgi:hypothetical protein
MTETFVPLNDLSRIVAKTNQVSCDMAGETVVLNLENGVYYGMDLVAARIWHLVQELKTFAEVRETLLAEYDVGALGLEADLRGLLAQLAEEGLVEITA